MRTLYITFAIFFTAFFSIAQEIEYQDALKPVVINTNQKQETITGLRVLAINQQIAYDSNFKIRKAIKLARENDAIVIYFTATNRTVELNKSDYLVTLRKAANRADDIQEFVERVEQDLPDFKFQLDARADLLLFYENLRQDTFYGRIEALPSVL